MSLVIRKLQNNVWKHTDSIKNKEVILSSFYAKGEETTNTFEIYGTNGQNPLDKYEVSNISIIDDTTGTSYPSFASITALMIQLKGLDYVGFKREGDVVIADLISSTPSNIIELGTDGKLFAESSGGVIPRISTGYAKATDFGNINFYPKALFSNIPIQNNANNDTWLGVTFVNQRVIHHFGEAVSLDKITYVNGTRTVDGSSETFGAKDIVIYAITADVDPVFTYGTTDANYTQIFSGTLNQYTIAQSKTPPEITLTNVPANTFALVYDIANNYAASGRIEIRRLTAYKN